MGKKIDVRKRIAELETHHGRLTAQVGFLHHEISTALINAKPTEELEAELEGVEREIKHVQRTLGLLRDGAVVQQLEEKQAELEALDAEHLTAQAELNDKHAAWLAAREANQKAVGERIQAAHRVTALNSQRRRVQQEIERLEAAVSVREGARLVERAGQEAL